ncbi:hypothetical protein RsTz2092_08960 [Deferribacterales bacterium RsTz2092]|nr:hypothetical protein AGMMS49941_06310 [Deferribacterales bacterium]
MLKHNFGCLVIAILTTTMLLGCFPRYSSVWTYQTLENNKHIDADTNNFFSDIILPLGVATIDITNEGKCQFSDSRSITVLLPKGYDSSKAVSYMTLAGGTKIDGKLVASNVGYGASKNIGISLSTTRLEYYFPMSCADEHHAIFTLNGITVDNQPISSIEMEMIDYKTVLDLPNPDGVARAYKRY